MKTFKQFIEAPSASELLKIKHTKQRDALADKSKMDKERQSAEFQQMVTQQKSEKERTKRTDKSARLRKAAADKRKRQQAKGE